VDYDTDYNQQLSSIQALANRPQNWTTNTAEATANFTLSHMHHFKTTKFTLFSAVINMNSPGDNSKQMLMH